ncbi:probable FCF1 - putative PINc domain nuclease [Ustilago trichophora]|uniref:Probable FCF1 - putative PINc domain nuclease n=1 Tax=Ustilago trichophora TaxID=86804 RepID=A0A5C3DSW5_9BASI|nr:probable FCF1 - putative PINc domain nuclease [Ustilago trichophora]
MGKKKQVRKFGEVKRMLNPNDDRLKASAKVTAAAKKAASTSSSSSKTTPDGGSIVRHISTPASSMFFEHNTQLGPPYRILVDTNFINFALQNKIELVQGMMDCLYAKSIPCITTCVISELEKLGPKYRIALRVARDPRFERLECSHKGTYADDCIIERIQSHKCYIVATCDRELRRRVRKVPGIPLMYIASRQFRIERLPDQGMAQ